MNSLQTSRVLKEHNINGFNNISWEFRALEVIGNDQILELSLKNAMIF